MTIHTFYIPPENITDKKIILPKEEEKHALLVLRLKEGDEIKLLDGTGNIFKAKIISRSPLNIEIIEKNIYIPAKHLIVCVGMAKAKKIDLIIRQLTEIGCSQIIVFVSKRSIPDISNQKIKQRLQRWRKIAIVASKQSKREYLPEVKYLSFKELINSISLPILALYEKGGTPLIECLNNKMVKATLVIGPEGGFEESEISALEGQGAKICGMGRYILRVETASIYAASLASSIMEIS